MTKQTASPSDRQQQQWTAANGEKTVFTSLLERAGIRVDGRHPWDLRLNDPRAVGQILGHGNLGLGESYMAGWVDIPAVDQFIERVMRARLDIDPTIGRSWSLIWHALKARLLNRQNPVRAWAVGQRHYDLGNDFYRDMLDARMTYTCGYWAPGVATLDEAQEAKLDLICRKLNLQPGQRVLDIGCGWGSFMRFAAERYGVSCVGVTISRAQAEYGRQLCHGLPVEFRLQDYRDMDETFDHIVSVGMFEHVGRKNYATYMAVARRCLKPDGLFLLHTITGGSSHSSPDPWIDKYIFPNGETPSHRQIAQAAEDRFVIEDIHNFGADYDRTLMAWHENFTRAWPKYQSTYGETFERMWRYYLLSCAGAFRSRQLNLLQCVLSPTGVRGGYVRQI